MILKVIGAFIAAFSFGVIFNIKKQNLLICAIGGSLGFLMYLIMSNYNNNIYLSYFVSSLTFSLYSEIMARKYKTPVIVFLVISLIILVPGKGMYDTMLEIVLGSPEHAMVIGLDTLSIALSLAFGVIFANTITKTYYRIKCHRNRKCIEKEHI